MNGDRAGASTAWPFVRRAGNSVSEAPAISMEVANSPIGAVNGDVRPVAGLHLAVEDVQLLRGVAPRPCPSPHAGRGGGGGRRAPLRPCARNASAGCSFSRAGCGLAWIPCRSPSSSSPDGEGRPADAAHGAGESATPIGAHIGQAFSRRPPPLPASRRVGLGAGHLEGETPSTTPRAGCLGRRRATSCTPHRLTVMSPTRPFRWPCRSSSCRRCIACRCRRRPPAVDASVTASI